MEFLYPCFMAFFIVFMSELGDKTQLLVLSFSSKMKSYTILLGVALGSLFSHGLAIAFGSTLGSLDNAWVHIILEFITYLSFLFFGVVTLFEKEDDEENTSKSSVLKKISNLSVHYIFIIALSIAVGELGDKTFLASLGLGIGYPNVKIFLILGAVLGMVVSDAIAIIFGKILSHKLSKGTMNLLSGFIFLGFGIFGMIKLFIDLL